MASNKQIAEKKTEKKNQWRNSHFQELPLFLNKKSNVFEIKYRKFSTKQDHVFLSNWKLILERSQVMS